MTATQDTKRILFLTGSRADYGKMKPLMQAVERHPDLECSIAITGQRFSSVKDKHGRHAVFTPFAVPCNIDFEKMEQENYSEYQYELLPSTHFCPPAGGEHPVIHPHLKDAGIRYIDVSLNQREHQGQGRYKRRINYTGKKTDAGLVKAVRNVVFEPTDERGVDWVGYSLKQIEAAFRWYRPAIISSHRVNFCGHIDPENRNMGLTHLKRLLKAIVSKWPDVEFLSSEEMMDLIQPS